MFVFEQLLGYGMMILNDVCSLHWTGILWWFVMIRESQKHDSDRLAPFRFKKISVQNLFQQTKLCIASIIKKHIFSVKPPTNQHPTQLGRWVFLDIAELSHRGIYGCLQRGGLIFPEIAMIVWRRSCLHLHVPLWSRVGLFFGRVAHNAKLAYCVPIKHIKLNNTVILPLIHRSKAVNDWVWGWVSSLKIMQR